jgi:hypothetical protein
MCLSVHLDYFAVRLLVASVANDKPNPFKYFCSGLEICMFVASTCAGKLQQAQK